MNKKKGFFLVELLISISIFTVFTGITTFYFSQLSKQFQKAGLIKQELKSTENNFERIIAGQYIKPPDNIKYKTIDRHIKKIVVNLTGYRKMELIIEEE